jgi:hypothetical protein
MKLISNCLLGVMMLFIAGNVFGQLTGEENLPDDMSIAASKSAAPLKFQKLHLSLNIGAGFMTSKYHSGAFTTIAPNLNYMVTPKFKLEVGGVFLMGNTNFYQVPGVESQKSVFQKSNQMLIYTQGQYLVNDRLMITGSLFKAFDPYNSSKLNPYSLDYKGMNIGLDYKVTKNITFGAQIRYSNGNGYMNNGGMGLYSPGTYDIFGNRYNNF